MRHPDPLIMSADIARMAAERPELDGELVQAIYQHLVLIEGRQPGLGEVREYVDRVSSLIRPPRRDFVFTYIHGITWLDVQHKPSFAELWPEISSVL